MFIFYCPTLETKTTTKQSIPWGGQHAVVTLSHLDQMGEEMEETSFIYSLCHKHTQSACS